VVACHSNGLSTGGVSTGKDMGDLAYQARRLADCTVELSARVTAMAPLIPSPTVRSSSFSSHDDDDAHDGGGEVIHPDSSHLDRGGRGGKRSSGSSKNKGSSLPHNVAAADALLEMTLIDERTSGRGRVAQLVGGIAVKVQLKIIIIIIIIIIFHGLHEYVCINMCLPLFIVSSNIDIYDIYLHIYFYSCVFFLN
jgi:hypothetical protein